MDGQATIPLCELDRLRNIESDLVAKAKNPDNVTVFRLDYYSSYERIILMGRDELLIRLAKELGEAQKELKQLKENCKNTK